MLAKTKLDTKLVLISKTLIDSLMSQDKFVSINNVLKECEDMKEKIMFDVTRQILYILYQHNEIIKKPGNNRAILILGIYSNNKKLVIMTSPRTICFQLLIEVTKSLKYEIKFITSCKETLAEYTIKFFFFFLFHLFILG